MHLLDLLWLDFYSIIFYSFSLIFEIELWKYLLPLLCVRTMYVWMCAWHCACEVRGQLWGICSLLPPLHGFHQIPWLLQVAHLPVKHTLERCFALYWPCILIILITSVIVLLLLYCLFLKQIVEQNPLDL